MQFEYICVQTTQMNQAIKVSVDAIVFGYDPEDGVSVLLITRKYEPFKKYWALPGGLVKNDESLEDAVKRELHEEAGIELTFLEQLYSFGEPMRDPRNRVISVAYYGLIRPKDYQISASTDAEDVGWFSIKKLPKLAFDHKQIVDMAVKRVRGKIAYEPIGFDLLDKKFPFSDLEKLYQTLLDRELDRRNFKKKIMAHGFIEELNESVQRGAGRPARLFQFNKKKYFELKEQGYHSDLFL
jgi:8-oxo-dGTP diphosphatase